MKAIIHFHAQDLKKTKPAVTSHRTSAEIIRLCIVLLLLSSLVVVARVGESRVGECPGDMVYIPGGSAVIGISFEEAAYLNELCTETTGGCYMEWFTRETPRRIVKYDSYCIDRYEYPGRRDVLPYHDLTWELANRYCISMGKRLCTEVEWQRACMGPSNYEWSYGFTFEKDACNIGTDMLERSGERRNCRTVEGVFDMNGNLAEWVAGTARTSGRATSGPPVKILKGGSFASMEIFSRCSFRDFRTVKAREPEFGARCCLNYE